MFMYKRYGVSMYFMLLKAAREALKGETPEIRKAAMRQIGGIMGMSALMAGAQGIPMFGALSLVYSLFTDDDEDDLDAVTQKALGDFLYKGPVEYATNLAIAGRITLNDLIIRDAPKGSASTFSQQLAQALGGPVVGVADRIQRGYSTLNEGNVSRAMEDLLPSAVANGFKAYRYATEGTKTLRGDPITGEVSLYNTVGQALGFAPADYTRQLEINSREKGIDKVVNTEEMRSALFQSTMENLKKVDAQPSQMQQQIMQQAFGTIGTDPAAIPKIVAVYKDILTSKAVEHNARVKQSEEGPAKMKFAYDITVKVPETTKPPVGGAIPNINYNSLDAILKSRGVQ
jgi:hypothetical protein